MGWRWRIRLCCICLAALVCTLRSSSPVSPAPLIPAKFSAPPLFSVAGSGVGIGGFYFTAKGDFNGDGIPDFAVVGFACANGGANQDGVAVYLGKGDGTFSPPAVYPAGGCTAYVTTGRLRGPNAAEDLIVVNEAFDQIGIAVLLGNGDGTFQSPTLIATPSTPTAVVVGDFNGDGKPDIAVSLFGGSGQNGGNLQTLGVLLGHGDGTFGDPVLYQSLNNPYNIAVGDFNNDGKLDLVVRSPDALALSLGNGDGTFQPGYVILAEPSTLLSVTPPGPVLNGLVSFVIGDFNEDGNLDVAAAEDGERLDVLLGTGTGTFLPPVTYLNNAHQTGSGGGQITVARLTNNGHIDLVVTTGYGTTLAIFRGNGDGTFSTTPDLYPLPQYDDEGLIIADVNSDGRPDIVIGTMGARGSDPNFLSVLLNDGTGHFGKPPPLYSVKSTPGNEPATNAVGIKLADLTKRGKLDAIVTDWDVPIEPLANGQIPSPPVLNPNNGTIDTHGTISILPGKADGSFGTEQQYFVGGRPIAVETADLTGDGKIDIVVVDAFDNQLSVLKGNGDRTYQAAITIPVGTNPTSLALADFDRDGKTDIAVTNLVDNTVSILINQSTPGNIRFKPAVIYSVGTYPAGVVVGDFNHDGKFDLAVASSGDFFASDAASKNSTLSILLGNGDGTFAPATTHKLWNGIGADAIVAGDFGRGETDLAVANYGTPAAGQVLILRGDGHGGFAPAGTYMACNGAEGLVAADFNGDGKLDLAVTGLNDYAVAILIGNGDATFVPAAQGGDDAARPFGFATWGYPAFVAAGDLNGDGKPEIVTTHLFEAAIAVLRNTTPTVPLTSVVSRKVHGSAGTFAIDLTSGHGVECRSGGAGGDYTVVFTFANPLTRVSGATVSSGAGSVRSSNIDSNDAHKYVVNLTGVSNAQKITIVLNGVGDAIGNVSGSVVANMTVLIGDVNATGVVDSGDVFLVRQQTGHTPTAANFREDVNASGLIDSGDVFVTRQHTATSVP
jgi:hypothetical protein